MYRARSREPSPAPRSGRVVTIRYPACVVRLAGACGRPWVNASPLEARREPARAQRGPPWSVECGAGQAGDAICAPSGLAAFTPRRRAGSARSPWGTPRVVARIAGGWGMCRLAARAVPVCWACGAATDGDADGTPAWSPGGSRRPARRRPDRFESRCPGRQPITVPAVAARGPARPHRTGHRPAATAPARPHRRRRRRAPRGPATRGATPRSRGRQP